MNRVDTKGYDVIFEIDGDSVLASLERLVVDAVATRLTSLDLAVVLPPPAPANTIQQGTLATLGRPTAALVMPAAGGNPTLTVTFPQMLLSLTAVPGVLGFAGVGALAPAAAGSLAITFELQLSTTQGNGSAVLQIQPAVTPTVGQVSSLPNLAGLTNLITLAPLVHSAITAAVGNALASVFPIRLPVPFGERGLCGIGPRRLDVKFLEGPSPRKPSLGFFLTLRDGLTPRLTEATRSSLTTTPNNVAGAMSLANPFLKALVCCLFESNPEVINLGAPEPHTDTDACCHWAGIDNVTLGDQLVRIEELDICLEAGTGTTQSKFVIKIHATQSGSGWTAHAKVTIGIEIRRSGTALDVFQLEPDVESWTDVEWWVWLLSVVTAALGAIVGAIIGSVIPGIGTLTAAGVGAGIGFALGLALAGVAYLALKAIGGLAENAVGAALGVFNAEGLSILPPAITENFGAISDVVVVDFDDLAVGGHVRPPRRDNIVNEGSNIVLGYGDRIDLDRGIIARAGQSVAGIEFEADLVWRRERLVLDMMEMTRAAPDTGPRAQLVQPATALSKLVPGVDLDALPSVGVIAPLRNARVVATSGVSFWSLTESALEGIAFPQNLGTSIAGTTLVVSDSAYPQDARVFAVRTTSGKLAKCGAWRDSHGQLHLSYVTYDTYVPLWIRTQWQLTRGPGTLHVSEYQVARRGTFEARFPTAWFLPQPTYRWLWNDVELTGTGTLPDGTTTFSVQGKTCELRTAMGKRLRGVLQVELTAFARTFVSTTDLDLPGTEREELVMSPILPPPSPTPPPPPPRPTVVHPPLGDQLVTALARGMNLPPEKIEFK